MRPEARFSRQELGLLRAMLVAGNRAYARGRLNVVYDASGDEVFRCAAGIRLRLARYFDWVTLGVEFGISPGLVGEIREAVGGVVEDA